MSAWWRCGRMKRSESGSRRSSSDEHLVGRVAAPRAVALHLPVAAQLLGRVEVDAHVEALAELAVVEAEQPLADDERGPARSTRAARTCRRCAGRRAS